MLEILVSLILSASSEGSSILTISEISIESESSSSTSAFVDGPASSSMVESALIDASMAVSGPLLVSSEMSSFCATWTFWEKVFQASLLVKSVRMTSPSSSPSRSWSNGSWSVSNWTEGGVVRIDNISVGPCQHTKGSAMGSEESHCGEVIVGQDS